MLSLSIAHDRGLTLPSDIADNSIISTGPKRYPTIKVEPLISSSHSVPNPLLGLSLMHSSDNYPVYIVLIRDIRTILISHYRKHQPEYNCSFEEYLSGDPVNKRFDKDVWWDIRFLNRWGDLANRFPQKIHIMKYENLMANTQQELLRASDILKIKYSNADEAVNYAIEYPSKDKMKKLEPTDHPFPIVREENRSWEEWYDEKTKHKLKKILNKHLKFDFGYQYTSW